MGIFDNLTIGNELGWYSFLSLILLVLLYLLRPKPLKKIIPSLIFLEKGEKRLNLATFFRKFIKDWLFFLQLFLIILLCLSTLDMTKQILIKKLSKEVVFVIDASASSNAVVDGKKLFDIYKDEAAKRVGLVNSVILIKNTPEVIVKQTNPFNARTAIGGLRPTESLSSIWDAMMLASDITVPKADIIIISDFADTNEKDLSVAKQILEAKGFNVEMINPNQKKLFNIGIIKFSIGGETATIDVKNYDDGQREIEISDGRRKLQLGPNAVDEFQVKLKAGTNDISIATGDNFPIDDRITIIVPKTADRDALFISNGKSTYMMAAMESIRSIGLQKSEPPIINVGDQNLFILNHVNYASILPGTIDKIRAKVAAGSSLIISAQDDLDHSKLDDLMPVKLGERLNQETKILNSATLDAFRDYNFALSSRYYSAERKDNASIIIAEANDKNSSPVIVLSKYGLGNVLYYGIFDDYNPFKLSTQYPLFWINMLEFLFSREESSTVNFKIGNILYGDDIKDPKGSRYSDYTVADKTGIYKVNDREVSVNLLNPKESDLNMGSENMGLKTADALEEKKVLQPVSVTYVLLVLALGLSLLEVLILKKRGDL